MGKMVNMRTRIKRCTLWLLLIIAGGWHSQAVPDAANNAHLKAAVPLTGTSGQTTQATAALPDLIDDSSEHFADIESANLDGLLERIGDSQVVLLGEATHGSHEFYQMRARITRELIEKRGFNIIAVEADWPDASRVDHFVRGFNRKPMFKKRPFAGFPRWMWANHPVLTFTHWLKDYNQRFASAEDAVGFYGLDLYNMFGSIEVVLDYLQDVDPKAAESARWRYGCLLPWIDDPSLYSRVSGSGVSRTCEFEVYAVYRDLLKRRELYQQLDKQRFFGAEQNARLARSGEHFFRTMYDDKRDAWNQRDQNMFVTLQSIMKYRGHSSKAVVWAHNSHIGDARATDMGAQGKYNLGQLVRETFGEKSYLIGFGTDHGTVAAASEWGAPMQVMQIQPSHEDSYERLFHDAKTDNFLLPLRHPVQEITRNKLLAERLERAIGTMYDPKTELKKHYFHASLPRQFDEYIWFDETRAVRPLPQKR
ncbi:MAG: erythromycin esterase family protein [Pseudomonadota bacterium]